MNPDTFPSTLLQGKICRYFLENGTEISIEQVARIRYMIWRYTWNKQVNQYQMDGVF